MLGLGRVRETGKSYGGWTEVKSVLYIVFPGALKGSC